MKNLMYIVLLAFTLSNCGENDVLAPTILYEDPGDANRFTVDDVIPVRALVRDDMSLEKITVSSSLGFNTEITSFDAETLHVVSFNLNLDPDTPAGTYSIETMAEDKAGNMAEASVVVIIM